MEYSALAFAQISDERDDDEEDGAVQHCFLIVFPSSSTLRRKLLFAFSRPFIVPSESSGGVSPTRRLDSASRVAASGRLGILTRRVEWPSQRFGVPTRRVEWPSQPTRVPTRRVEWPSQPTRSLDSASRVTSQPDSASRLGDSRGRRRFFPRAKNIARKTKKKRARNRTLADCLLRRCPNPVAAPLPTLLASDCASFRRPIAADDQPSEVACRRALLWCGRSSSSSLDWLAEVRRTILLFLCAIFSALTFDLRRSITAEDQLLPAISQRLVKLTPSLAVVPTEHLIFLCLFWQRILVLLIVMPQDS
ncbi:hypothetical protein AXF42_Ash005303 [Apostasia shenzhenica]|uniref:Uncharacterized protein n=1 Tax=Apostasia shenzhenica TaxID=1088818 RepID=A0A2I0B6I1_9ASPA|nr:hypothetical protein AXF42_Ash005303 [Apostasia shenzhenica]